MNTFAMIPFSLSVIAILIAVAVVYLRKHPQAVTQLDAALKAEFDKIHASFSALTDHLQLIHQVASAPVSVAVIPVAPAAPAAPVSDPVPAPINPGAPANTTDPTAPGFVMPANVAPPPAPAAAAPGDDWQEWKTGDITIPFDKWAGGDFVRAQGNCVIHFPVDPSVKGWITVGGNVGSGLPMDPAITAITDAGTQVWTSQATFIPFETLAYGGVLPAPGPNEVVGPAGGFTVTINQQATCGCVISAYWRRSN